LQTIGIHLAPVFSVLRVKIGFHLFKAFSPIRMLSFVARSSSTAVTQAVANGSKNIIPAVSIAAEKPIAPATPIKLNVNSLAAVLPKKAPSASLSIGGK
jgi:hypothetical protein